LSAPWAVLVDAASYLASGFLLLRVPVIEPARRRASLHTVRMDALEGLRWVYTHATLRPLALSTHSWFLCVALAGAVETPFALRSLGLNPFGLGLVLAVGGIGGLAGSLAATRLGVRLGTGRVVVACSALTGVAWGVIALSPHGPAGWVLFAAGQLLFGLSIGAENANCWATASSSQPTACKVGRMPPSAR
jgi:predicted MFS family arabinose efflux permease